jgi:hypothetical protein
MKKMFSNLILVLMKTVVRLHDLKTEITEGIRLQSVLIVIWAAYVKEAADYRHVYDSKVGNISVMMICTCSSM